MSGAAPRGRLILAITALLFAVPVLVDLAIGGARHVFDYLASDSYYYFVIARNIAWHGRVSFDGALPTNGFHPLWQAVCALVFLAGGGLAAVVALLVLSVALVVLGLVALGRGLSTVRALGWPFASLPVGAYALLVLPMWLAEPGAEEPVYGTLHSYVNGMESALLLCAYGLCASWFLRGRALDGRRGAIAMGLLLAALVLARLDALVLAIALLFALVPELRGRVAWVALAFALPIAIYLLASRIHAGAALPISGTIKSSFPSLNHANLDRLAASLRHPAQASLYRLYRLAQLVLPALAAIAQLLRRRRDRLDRFMSASAAGVLAISIYDLGFVELAEQGPWYHPLGTLFCSLWIVLRLARVEAGRSETALGLGAISVLSIVFFVAHGRGLACNRAFARFYLDEAPRLRAFYGEARPRFLEVDDGIFGFATGYDTMSGKGLALDREAARALQRGELVPLAMERGFDRVTSVLYMSLRGLDPSASSARACRLISGITPRELCEELDYAIEYAHGDFGVVRVQPLRRERPSIDRSAPRP